MADEMNVNPGSDGQKDFDQILAERNKTVTQKSGKRFLPGFIMIFIALSVAAIGYYAYQESISPVDVSELPTIKADKEGFKVEAKDSAENAVPNMDKKVYDAISGSPSAEGTEKKPEDAPSAGSGYEEPISRDAIINKAGTETPPQENAQQIMGSATTKEVQNKEDVKANVENSVISEVQEKSSDTIKKEPVKESVEETKTEPAIAKESTASAQAPEVKAIVQKKPEVKKIVKAKVKTSKESKAKPSAQKSYRIQLGAFPTEKEAKDTWNSLNKNNSGLLGDLTAQIHKADLEKGTFYRLQAGTIKSETEAKELCKKLSELKQDCFVVSGN